MTCFVKDMICFAKDAKLSRKFSHATVPNQIIYCKLNKFYICVNINKYHSFNADIQCSHELTYKLIYKLLLTVIPN